MLGKQPSANEGAAPWHRPSLGSLSVFSIIEVGGLPRDRGLRLPRDAKILRTRASTRDTSCASTRDTSCASTTDTSCACTTPDMSYASTLHAHDRHTLRVPRSYHARSS